MTNQEVKLLFLQALQEETCGTQTVVPATATTNAAASDSVPPIMVTPTPETTRQASINYWPIVAVAAFSYLFLTDGK